MKSPLSTGWQFSQVASSPHFDTVKEAWLDCEVPTSVHVELRNRGRIPDPFKGLAEWDVQCMSSESILEISETGPIASS